MHRYIAFMCLCLMLLAGTAQAVESAKSPTQSPEIRPSISDKSGDAIPASKLNLDFDLLGPSHASLTPPVDPALIKRRRLMLTLHQTIGIALAVGELGSIITGQLNYDDKFGGQNSGRYQLAHQLFVYPTEALAAVTAGLAIFAPVPIAKTGHGFDRMTLHKIGQFTAFAGWATELGLGIATAAHEGYANQRSFATAHLAVGYVTLAGILLGLGAITF